MSIQIASVAERLAYGRFQRPEEDALIIHRAGRPLTALVGRVLLGAIFLVSGIAKVTDPSGTVAHMTAAGIPYADVLVWVAGIAEILGGLSLIFGLLARLGGLGLLLFMIPTTLLFHDFWNLQEPERLTQMVNFMKNLAIMGGLMLLVASGPGRYSLDYKMSKPMEP